MIEVVFHPEARIDFRDAVNWYEDIRPTIAKRYVLAMQDAIATIMRSPEAFPPLDQNHRAFVMRKFPYHLVYRTRAAIVEIVAVSHNSRRPRYWEHR